MTETAVVTGTSMVTPLGDTDATWARLLDQECAARTWPDLADEGFPVAVACRADHVRTTDALHRGRDLATVAVREALDEAGVPEPGAGSDPARIGVFVGTTMGESSAFEHAADNPSATVAVSEAGGQVFGRHVAALIGAEGPVRVFGTACAAGNYAIGAAAEAVRDGVVDVAVAGGVEPFSRIALLGFTRMRAMTPDRCAPFASGRRGMQLGEAAAFVVVESVRAAAARGARPLARLGSLGLACDAYHPTAPRKDGSGMAAAMRTALARTDVDPSRIGWVSAHGTGTPLSDAAEALALHQVLGDAPPPVSSIKGAIGHSLGAAAAVETVVAVRALQHHLVPPNTSHLPTDDDLGLDVVTQTREMGAPDWVLSCAYAFGGLNSALMIGAAP